MPVLLGLLLAWPAGSASEEGPWQRADFRVPGEWVVRPEDEEVWIRAVQVVRAGTGEPVPDCRIAVSTERGRLVAGGATTPLGGATSDADGFATVPYRRSPEVTHLVFDAPGFRPLCLVTRVPDPRVELEPGGSGAGRVVDFAGRPRVGVEVSAFHGCGHAPTLARAVTDEDGRFTIREVQEGRYWLEGGGIAAGYGDELVGPAGELLFRVPPGVTIAGRVLGPDDEPLAGLIVRGEWRRGPAATTDGEGRFRLEGFERGGSITVWSNDLAVPERVAEPPGAWPVWEDTSSLILRFDPAEGRLLGEPPDRPAGPEPERVRIRIRFESLPPHLGTDSFDAMAIGAFIATEWGRVPDTELDLAAENEVLVPPGVPLAVHVMLDARARVSIFPVDPVPAGAGEPPTVSVRLPDIPAVRFRLPRDRDTGGLRVVGVDAGGGIRLLPSWEEEGGGAIGVALLDPELTGLLVSDPEVREQALLPLGGESDLGEVELEPVPRIRVEIRDNAGRPVTRIEVRSPLADPDEEPWKEVPLTGPDGAAVLESPLPVRRLLLSGEGLWGRAVDVSGAGPFRLSLPASTVLLVAPAGGRAWLDGRPLARGEGGLRLRGVPPGPHRLRLLLAAGERWERRITIEAGEDRRVDAPD